MSPWDRDDTTMRGSGAERSSLSTSASRTRTFLSCSSWRVTCSAPNVSGSASMKRGANRSPSATEPSRPSPRSLLERSSSGCPGGAGRRRPSTPHRQIYDIFEGTEQIQQLVIARAISGLRIEVARSRAAVGASVSVSSNASPTQRTSLRHRRPASRWITSVTESSARCRGAPRRRRLELAHRADGPGDRAG